MCRWVVAPSFPSNRALKLIPQGELPCYGVKRYQVFVLQHWVHLPAENELPVYRWGHPRKKRVAYLQAQKAVELSRNNLHCGQCETNIR